MGYKLIIPNANYETVILDPYLAASGITNPTIVSSYGTFKQTLIDNGIWDKITHAYAILGTTADQVKFNIKNASDPITNVGGGEIANTINKGIVLAGVGSNQGNVVDVPITKPYIDSIRTGSGHAMYFINESLTPTSTSAVANVISHSSSTVSSANVFYLSGSFGTVPTKKAFLQNTNGLQHAGNYTSPGAFAAIKNGNVVEFFGNGVSLGSGTTGGAASSNTGNIRLGDGKYPVANTVSFVSFGNVAMSAAEMIIYQNAVKTLIQAVHGISV